MKKYAAIALIAAVMLCSCGKKEKNEKLEFPRTTWDMSMEEAMDAWGVTEETVKDYDSDDVFVIEGYELFGEETESIHFQFYDYEGNGAKKLTQVFVTYPADADMDHVSEEMQKVYGEPDPDVTFYYPYSALEILKAYETKEPDSVTNWALGSVAEVIPADERNDYREPWEIYQYGLNEENWDQFIQDSRLIRISLLTDNGWNRVEFNAANQWIYETIQKQLSKGQ